MTTWTRRMLTALRDRVSATRADVEIDPLPFEDPEQAAADLEIELDEQRAIDVAAQDAVVAIEAEKDRVEAEAAAALEADPREGPDVEV